MSNGKIKIGILNGIASIIAFLFTVYITVIYIVAMTGNEANTIAYEIMSDNAINWVYRFVLVLLVYVCCLANLISIPGYLLLKRNGSGLARTFAFIQIISSTLMLLFVILFWASFGPIFISDLNMPFATVYRILEVIFIPVMIGLMIFNILYTPSDDVMRKLKKRVDKI